MRSLPAAVGADRTTAVHGKATDVTEWFSGIWNLRLTFSAPPGTRLAAAPTSGWQNKVKSDPKQVIELVVERWSWCRVF
jgi:hypothetical protein